MTVDRERLALETRAEALAFVSADAAVRRGESDRFEIGRLASSDAVDGREAQHTGGAHVESAHAHSLRAARLETRVDGGMSLRGRSDTTLLGGAMAETHAGPVLLMAGMSDALVAGGGMRVTVADLAVAGLVGLEEKIGSAIADGALIEAYATHFEREYGSGSHVAGFASFTGTVHVTSASGFRPLFKVASGVRNLTAGGGGGSGPEGAATQPARRPPPPYPPPPPPPSPPATGRPSDAARVLDDIAHYDEVPGYSTIRDIVGNADEPLYDSIHVRRSANAAEHFYDSIHSAPDIASETTSAGGRGLINEYSEVVDVGADASRDADTAEVLSNLRAGIDVRSYEDAQRGAVPIILNGLDSVPLSEDVDQVAVVARLEDAQLEANVNAMLAGVNGGGALEEARHNDAAQLYGIALSSVRAGEDPNPLLDRLAAFYRWRAERDLLAYPHQADAVADARASIDAALRHGGYRAGAADADQTLDAGLLARLEELFHGADEGAGATDELAVRIEDASDLLGNFLDDIDQGRAGTESPQNIAARDPQHLTLAELDTYQADSSWLGELSSAPGDLPGERRVVQDETPGNFVAAAREGSDAAERIRWQGRAADAEELVDLSTDNILVRSDSSDEAGLFDLNSWTEDNTLYERTDNHRQAEWHDNEQYVRRDEISDSLEESPRLAEVGGTQIPMLPSGDFPFVPPRLPNDVDADGFADFIGNRRKKMVDLLVGLPPTSDDVRWRAKIQALDLALEALERGHDPLALLDDRIRSAKLRQSAGTPLIQGEVEILSQVRQSLGSHFGTFRYSTGLHDFITVDEARQVDQLRLNVPPSLADARSAGAEASGESGKVVNDFVHGADEQSFDLRRDTRRRPHIYEDIDAIRPVLPAEPSRRGPPKVLSFASNDPTRFLGRAQDGDTKPVFALTDREFAAWTAGDLNLVVVDAHSRKSLSYDDFVIRHDVDDQPFGLRRDLGMQSHIDENTDAIGPVLPAEPSRRGPPEVLNFESDDQNRLVGRVRNSGLHGDPKPVFALTDSEFAAWNAGYLSLVIVDMNSLKSLSHDDFIIRRARAVERWQSLPNLAADSTAAEITASGHRITSPHGGGLSATPPSAGGAARPRQRSASFIDDQFLPI